MYELDQSQRAFCQASVGNVRLLAPAGCGKTLSLLFRCKHLSEHGKSQRPRFLIVTFTRAARDELATRLNEDDRFSRIRDLVEISTLNSWGFRRIKSAASYHKLITTKEEYHFAMLNQLQPVWQKHDSVKSAIEHNKFGVPRKLMDTMDTFKSLGFDHVRDKNFENFSGRLARLREQGLKWKLQEQFDALVRLGILESRTTSTGEEVAQASDRHVYNAFFTFWREATALLISNSTFTLEDQKYFAYLDEQAKLEQGHFLSGAARYDHVLVDEFQDINPLDLALIRAITERNRATLTIVGDDDQAIFEWRGATPEYILDPERFFQSKFTTHVLTVNYRSPANIVQHSQSLIRHNLRRVPKDVRSSDSWTAQIEVRDVHDLNEALDTVYEEVKTSVGEGQSPSRVAVIGRKRSQIIPYQVFFASKDVAFCAAEDLQVFMSDAFDRLLKLLMIKERADVRNTRSQVVDDLLELANLVKHYPIKKSEKENLRKHLAQSDCATLVNAVDALASYRGTLKGNNAGGTMSRSIADSIREFLQAETVSLALTALADSFEGLQMDLGKAEDDVFYTDPPFLQLVDFAARYGSNYGLFVEDIERAKEQLAFMPPFEDDDGPTNTVELWKRPLHLMTALRAKGKEFDTVILLDVNDGIWPSRNARTPNELESERRVFYVAFTRARKKVLMLVNSRLGNREAVVSPYIEELGL